MIIKRYSQKKIIKPQIQEELPAESAAPVQPEPVVQQQAVPQEQENQEDTSDIFAGFNYFFLTVSFDYHPLIFS